MRAALLACAFLALSAPSPARAQNKAEFSSPNKAFRLKVSYSGAGGAGHADMDFRTSGGRKISSFRAEPSPFTVTISDDGRRLFLFCGSWGQAVSIFRLNVLASSGERLASHKLVMTGPAGESFSADNSVYAIGADRGDARTILVLDTATGKKRWRRDFRETISGLKLSGDGGHLLAVLGAGRGVHRAALFDEAGAEVWSSTITTRNTLSPRVFRPDGAFELWEGRSVFDEKAGYWQGRVVKKHYFRFSGEGVEPAGVKKTDEPY